MIYDRRIAFLRLLASGFCLFISAFQRFPPRNGAVIRVSSRRTREAFQDGLPTPCLHLAFAINLRLYACTRVRTRLMQLTYVQRRRTASRILIPCICATVRIEFQLYACHSPGAPWELHLRHLAPLHLRLWQRCWLLLTTVSSKMR